jgi:hypothetical protein
MTAIRRQRPSGRLVVATGILGLAGMLVAAATITVMPSGRVAPVIGTVGDRAQASEPPPPSGTPAATEGAVLSATDSIATPAPAPTASAPPTRDPSPVRASLDVDIVTDHKAVFAHEIKKTWCASAGVQMTLAILGLGDTSPALQREIQGRVGRWDSYADSHNGRWGPTAMARALAAYGAKGYEVRTYKTRQGALRGAAKAIEETGAPVILLAWRGAHTWVMTGFRADADPAIFADATIKGAYILDPWYPSVSSIWGRSDPPGTFQDNAEMVRNYLPWKRPEGKYPGRDGLFVAVVPTVAIGPAN